MQWLCVGLKNENIFMSTEKTLFDFCKFLGREGYKINGYDDGQLNAIIKKFLNNKSDKCPTCGGKWTVYIGCSRSWREEPHCFGCRKPIENCTC